MKDLEHFLHMLNTHDWKPEQGRTGILLIDLQEYFREMITPIHENIIQIIALARDKNIPLFFTQHGHDPEEDSGMLGEWWADLIMKGSNEARLLPELHIGEKDIVIAKNKYSAFFKTSLEEKLKELNIKDLIIGGVMTNLCCETTARDAFVRDYRVFFLADGTSTANEDFQLATLKNLSYGFATLLTCRQFVDTIEAWKS